MRDERGQAVLLAVFLIAIAAAAIAGLRLQQDRAFTIERSRRAGEAAAEAATTAVADAYTAELREAIAKKRATNIGRVLGSDATREAARGAASEASAVNGGSVIENVTIGCGVGRVEITIMMSGASYRAGFPAGECSRR